MVAGMAVQAQGERVLAKDVKAYRADALCAQFLFDVQERLLCDFFLLEARGDAQAVNDAVRTGL